MPWPLQGNKVPCPCIFGDHTTGGQCPKNTCCTKSQSHERLWPPLLKLKFGNGWLISYCCSSSCKKFNSGFQFQFQFQFQGFQFQFHFQFHQFQFQFQFRNWNWNWAAIPIPELNWPQPWSWHKNTHQPQTALHEVLYSQRSNIRVNFIGCQEHSSISKHDPTLFSDRKCDYIW